MRHHNYSNSRSILGNNNAQVLQIVGILKCLIKILYNIDLLGYLKIHHIKYVLYIYKRSYV